MNGACRVDPLQGTHIVSLQKKLAYVELLRDINLKSICTTGRGNKLDQYVSMTRTYRMILHRMTLSQITVLG